MTETIHIAILLSFKGLSNSVAMARYIPIQREKGLLEPIIHQYLDMMPVDYLVESLSASIIHELIHWVMDLSNEDYKNERLVCWAERKLMEWLFYPEYRGKIMAIVRKLDWRE